MPENSIEAPKPGTDGTPPPAPADGTPTPDPIPDPTPDPQPELDTLLKDKRVQGEIDRRIASMQKTLEQKYKESAAAAAQKAKHEAEEARLLEKEDLKGLLELKAKEADDAKAQLAQYEHDQKVNQLLDKKGVTDPDIRSLFLRFNGDLTDLDPVIDKFNAQVGALVEKTVNERLKTPPPPPKNDPAKPAADTSLEAQIAAAEKAGDYKESFRLKQMLSNQLNQNMRRAPASVTEMPLPGPMPGA